MLRIAHIKEKRLSLFGKKETACNDIKNMVEEVWYSTVGEEPLNNGHVHFVLCGEVVCSSEVQIY